jgi:hypothetical protein
MKQMLLLMAIVSLFTFSLTAQTTNNLSGFYNVKKCQQRKFIPIIWRKKQNAGTCDEHEILRKFIIS